MNKSAKLDHNESITFRRSRHSTTRQSYVTQAREANIVGNYKSTKQRKKGTNQNMYIAHVLCMRKYMHVCIRVSLKDGVS